MTADSVNRRRSLLLVAVVALVLLTFSVVRWQQKRCSAWQQTYKRFVPSGASTVGPQTGDDPFGHEKAVLARTRPVACTTPRNY